MSIQTKKQSGISPLLTHFAGLLLTIELKNGKVYHGTLSDADHSMNLTLNHVSIMQDQWDADGRKRRMTSFHQDKHTLEQMRSQQSQHPQTRSQPDDFELVHIRGSSIRYIIFPENVNLPVMVKIGIERTRAATDKYKRGSRAKRQA